jgi:dUTP pyrophosphatase
MYRSGAFVADHVEPTTDAQRQPNGVDLTLEAVFRQCEPGRIGRDDKAVGGREELDPIERGSEDFAPEADGDDDTAGDNDAGGDDDTGGRVYRLPPGGYVVRYGETVSIPADHVGFIYPRSSLLRNSCMLDTAVWDAGYEGKGEGLLEVYHDVEIEAGARIAQFVLAEANHEGTYDGTYQGENVREGPERTTGG